MALVGRSAHHFLLDQLTKIAIVGAFQLGESLPITSFFNLVRVHNEGAAFSFLADAGGWQRWFFTGLGVVAAMVMVYLLRMHAGQTLFCLALSLLLGGAVGNVVDRVLYSHVIDFRLLLRHLALPCFQCGRQCHHDGRMLVDLGRIAACSTGSMTSLLPQS